MRVIKHLKRQTPQEKLKRFFLGLTIVTKIILVLLLIVALFLALSSSNTKSSIFGLYSMRMTEVILFIVMGLSDLKREEGKGSYYLILSFAIKNILLVSFHKIVTILLPNWPQLDILVKTSTIQLLFTIMVQDAFASPDNLKYLFIQPFQLKARFYPLLFFVMLMIAGLRVDLIIPLVIGLVCHFAKINQLFTLLSNKLDQKYLSQRMLQIGFLKTGSHERTLKPLDELTTNDSIYLQQK